MREHYSLLTAIKSLDIPEETREVICVGVLVINTSQYGTTIAVSADRNDVS